MAKQEGDTSHQQEFVIEDGKLTLPKTSETGTDMPPSDPRSGWAKPEGWLKRTINGSGRNVKRTGPDHESHKFD